MLIIGTAGHIDHGKSSIVKRLTGTDPDRLPEEKERGMTIDLGFAFRNRENGDTIAFVDVPGHERFVKNMVAGVGAIDAVMLVIAADDGWMPQSEEHFQIVRLLSVRQGIIAINKIDLVDDSDWLDLLEAEIEEKVKGSFLEGAPIFKLSAQTGEGFDVLNEYLDEFSQSASSQKDSEKARLYIDRSFVRPGIGGVVTGTLRGGELHVGQNVTVWPSLEKPKIRSLHSNNKDVETAVPGQRTAVSFTGIDKENLVRGGVITTLPNINQLKNNQVLALSVEMLEKLNVALSDQRKILMIIGTTEIEGEIRIFGAKSIKPGESGIVFFIPDEPVLTLIGDRYIMRLPTPMVTLGGGEVLDHLKRVPRRKDYPRYEYLNSRIPVKLEDLIVSELRKSSIVPVEQLLLSSVFSAKEIDRALKTLFKDKVIQFFKGAVFHIGYVEESIENILSDMNDFLQDKPHLKGLPIEEIIKLTDNSEDELRLILDYLVNEGRIVKLKDKYNPVGRGMSLKGSIKKAHDEIMKKLSEDPLFPPTLALLSSGGKDYKEAIKFIIETEQGYKCGSDFIFLSDVWEEIVTFFKEHLNKNNQIAVADLKDHFGFSRKFAIPILEETDRIKLTRRDGDVRRKGADFGSF